jgi:hypothetical protein
MMHSGRTTRPKSASAENRRASQKPGPLSELGLLHARQIGNSEKPSAERSSLISAAVGVVAPRCWSKAPRAFLTSFCRNPGSRSKLAIPCRSSLAELTGLFRRQLGAQWPMMRTEGSFTKAPAVVPRPVASISQRSIMRMGETVVVPTRRTLMRCGISEPVTKTVCSVTFSFRSVLPLTGVSASEALAAIRIVTPAASTLFTTQNTPAGWRCKSSKKGGPNTRRSNPSRVYQDSEAFAGLS